MITIVTRTLEHNIFPKAPFFLLDGISFKMVEVQSIKEIDNAKVVSFKMRGEKRVARSCYTMHLESFQKSAILIKTVQMHYIHVNNLVIVDWSNMREDYFVCRVTEKTDCSITVQDIYNKKHVREVLPKNAYHLHKYKKDQKLQLKTDAPLSANLANL